MGPQAGQGASPKTPRWVRVSVGTGYSSRAEQGRAWETHMCEGVLAPPPRGAERPQPITMETRQGLLEPGALVWISNPMLLSQKQVGQTFQIGKVGNRERERD